MFKQAFIYGLWRDGEIPDIYLQSMKYWEKYRNEVRVMYSEGISPGGIDKVSLHIRRGDYVENPFYVDLTKTDYYAKAVALFPHDTFLVFCKDNQGWEQDKADRQWCREYLDKLIPGRYELVDKDNAEWEDMNLMASCKAHIAANSSFSWWAAFLGGGRSVFPKAWFTDGEKRIDLLPEWETL